jgi:ATP-binding cassette subfamily B protein
LGETAVRSKDHGSFLITARDELEEKVSTLVRETGKKLSGGVKQKIAIARALLRKADILIFDEATTHLDKDSVRQIGELIKTNFKGKTCLIISHQSC